MVSFPDLVDSFVESPIDDVMCLLIDSVQQNDPTDEDVAYLATTLAKSGKILSFGKKKLIADIASTGGPGSLSTLLCPLFLQAFRCAIPKLSVPGRPAGGIDVLAQIPGYRYELNESEIKHIISHSGYAHFLASKEYTPLDATLFEFRKHTGTLNVPPVVIASILAKKIALGVTLIGLDVRVAQHGNFGQTFANARKHAERFCRIADLVERKAVCFLSDNQKPYQPFIGRGESLVALSYVFDNCPLSWLQNHVDTCYAMARRLMMQDTRCISASRPSCEDLASFFRRNLEAQGATFDAFLDYVAHVKADHRYEIPCPKDGFLNVDLGALRSIITSLQSKATDVTSPFPDPCGVILKKNSGEYVLKGEPIASIRMAEILQEDPLRVFQEAFQVSIEPQVGEHFEEVVNG